LVARVHPKTIKTDAMRMLLAIVKLEHLDIVAPLPDLRAPQVAFDAARRVCLGII